MRKVRVGIIGFGRIGNEHTGWLSRCASIAPVAVFDPTAERRTKAEALGLKSYDSLDSLLASDVDAVLVSTPTVMHCEQALSALGEGKHVMVEKPMSLDLTQSQKLVAAAKSVGKVLSVFHNRRWDLDYLTAKNAIASGKLGRVFNVESRLGQWGSCVGPAAREWRPGWRNEAAFGGGGLYDWGSHFLDQLWRLLLPAQPVRLFAQLRGNVWTSDCDDFARVCIDFDTGCAAMVEINTTTTHPLPRWHIDGTLGSVESPFSLDFNVNQWAALTLAPASADAPHRLPLAAKGLDEVQIWERFAASISGSVEPAVRAASVLPTMALLDAARHSARSGNSVLIPSDIDWLE
jgi:scyllo-inositol 2-dehydrogenase (NADP+)